MNPKPQFRTNGAIGALLDEYEKALTELKRTISDLTREKLIRIIDAETQNEECKSIQTILSHIVQSGYTYVVEIRKWIGEQDDYRPVILLDSLNEYHIALDRMFHYTEQLFLDQPHIKLTEYDFDKKIKVRWGQSYDVEQLMQHAIVHVLRHRRQIEKFKLQMRTN